MLHQESVFSLFKVNKMISSKDISFFCNYPEKIQPFYPGRKIGIIVFVLPYKKWFFFKFGGKVFFYSWNLIQFSEV